MLGIAEEAMDQEQFKRIQKLISDLELCHHKAERHVELIIQAIGEGHTTKGYQALESERKHPSTRMWQNAIDILSAWGSGDISRIKDAKVGSYSAEELVGLLGERTKLKEWQVQQVVSKLKAASRMYPGFEYPEMIEYPERYKNCRHFRNQTVETKISDLKDGEKAEISLGTAIDHLEPCNWNFPENLVLVLGAINGDLSPKKPFAAHGRNIRINPISERMRTIANTLRAFCDRPAWGNIDKTVLKVLGTRNPEKEALTIMLQEKIDDIFG